MPARRASRRSSGLDNKLAYDVDEIELNYPRASIHPSQTVNNMQKVDMLCEIYSTLEREVLQDLLVSANYRVDIAAQMASELVGASTNSTVCGADPVRIEMDSEDEELWQEVSARRRRSDPHQWVMVQDEWEVVDIDEERVRTFADVLRSASKREVVNGNGQILPSLSIAPFTASYETIAKKTTSKIELTEGNDELCIKSFGARRRKFMKKRR